MHQHIVAFRMQQSLPAQPGEQFVPVGRAQHFIQRVGAMKFCRAFGNGQQVQVVIAENGDGAVAQRFDQAQHLQRIRPAIDQIAHQPESVLRGIETYLLQQLLKLDVTTLNVAYCIDRH